VSRPATDRRVALPSRPVLAAQVLLVVAGVLYAGVHLEALAGWPLHPARSYLSELAALDQPTSGLFRAADFAAGTFVVGGVALLAIGYRRGRASGRERATSTQRVTAWALLAFGLATMTDALLPLDCAVSIAGCAAREAAGDVSAIHVAHTYSSVTAGLASFVASVGVALLARARRRTPLGVTARVAGVVGPVLGTVTGVIGMAGGSLPTGAGIAQRLQIVAFSLVLALAVQVLRVPQRRAPAPPHDAANVPERSEASPRDA
jgi:hypothetical protein